jgi:hypothetical protein
MVAAAVGAGVSLYSANRSSKGAKGAVGASRDASAAELDFAMEQYDDWQAVFGDLQKTLANYYENLSPELITAQGLEQYNLERDRSLQTIQETLAQRGLGNSGLAAAVETQTQMQSASDRARIRAEAPMRTAAEQSKFLQIGLGQNPAAAVQNTLAGAADRAAGDARTAAAAAGQANAAATQSVMDFISNADIFKSK